MTIKKAKSGTKKRKKMALGRGLGALIPDISTETEKPRDFFYCDIDLIQRNRYQPRKRFAEGDLLELSESIKSQGIIQPLLVRSDDVGYELVAGERRLRAAKKAGLKQVPVLIKKLSDSEILEMSIVENIQREDFNPIEEAEAYHRLITEFNLTQDQAAAKVGKSRSAVANFLRLRQLPEQIKESIIDGKLSMGHARALLGAEDPVRQLAVWRTVMAKGLSVRDTEALIKQEKTVKKPTVRPELTSEEIYFADLADNLSRVYGTKVKINRRGRKGKVEIEFYNDEDLNRLIELLKKS